MNGGGVRVFLGGGKRPNYFCSIYIFPGKWLAKSGGE